jgi:hypothetical protein
MPITDLFFLISTKEDPDTAVKLLPYDHEVMGSTRVWLGLACRRKRDEMESSARLRPEAQTTAASAMADWVNRRGFRQEARGFIWLLLIMPSLAEFICLTASENLMLIVQKGISSKIFLLHI